jgi:HK97 gp10 family phage protein
MSRNIIGLDKLLNKLSELGGDVVGTLEKSVGKNVKLVQRDAKYLCPVDLGDLRNSINTKTEVSSTGVKGIVYTNSDHAAYQEFGTGQRGSASPSPPKADIDLEYREDWAGIEAQPFLYPALKNQEDKVVERIKKDVKTAIREVAAK